MVVWEGCTGWGAGAISGFSGWVSITKVYLVTLSIVIFTTSDPFGVSYVTW